MSFLSAASPLIRCSLGQCEEFSKFSPLCGCFFCGRCITLREPEKVDQRLVWRCLNCEQENDPEQFARIGTEEIRSYTQIKSEVSQTDRKCLLVAVCFLLLFGGGALKVLLDE